MSKQSRPLGTFTLAMLTMAAIISLRNLPLTAEMGLSAVFFLIVAGLIFFIPTALVVAELASTWPDAGGCYIWVSKAFGKKVGFLSLWLSWMASVAWFPVILAFIATVITHIVHAFVPGLAVGAGWFMGLMLLVFWGTTILNFYGIELSGVFSAIGVVAGTLIPGALIIGLGVWWLLDGNPTVVAVNWQGFVPDLSQNNLILFAGVVLSLAGVELAAYHVRDAVKPQRSYPRAVFLATLMILLVYILGTLSIVIIVPPRELSLIAGLLQAFTLFFNTVGVVWIVPLLSVLLLLGALAGLNAWVIGPAKGMLVVAKDGLLPRVLAKTNDQGVPVNLLLLQALASSFLALLFMCVQNSSTAIWILTALSAQFTVLVYILIFAAAFKLRFTHAEVARGFRAPCLHWLSGLGIVVCVFSFLVVFLPHDRLVSFDHMRYCVLLVLILLVLSMPPLYFFRSMRSK